MAACIRWAEREEERDAAAARADEGDGVGGGGAREDMSVRCKDCVHDFVFSVAEQEFFAAKEWSIPRLRCKACTQVKKEKKEAADGRRARLKLKEITFLSFGGEYSFR